MEIKSPQNLQSSRGNVTFSGTKENMLSLGNGRYTFSSLSKEHTTLGNLYEGWDIESKCQVTIKCLAPEAREKVVQKAIENINKTTENVKLKDPQKYLTRIIFHEYKEETNWLIIESFPANLKQYVESKGSLDLRSKIFIMQDCCEAVQFLHSFDQPIFHRLLKPKTILIKRGQPRDIAKITDYYMAEIFDKTPIWKKNSTLIRNTTDKYFLPPEYFQHGSIPTYDDCTAGYDTFCLGTIYHALITGNAKQFWTAVPVDQGIGSCLKDKKQIDLFSKDIVDREIEELQKVITKMLEREPGERLPLNQVLQELKRVVKITEGTFDDADAKEVDEQGSLLNNIQQICKKFIVVLNQHNGRLKPTDDTMISEFQKLTPDEVKCVMKVGSIQEFLLQYADEEIGVHEQNLVVLKHVQDVDDSHSDSSDEPENLIDQMFVLLHKKLFKNKELASKLGSTYPDKDRGVIYISVLPTENPEDIKNQMETYTELSPYLKFVAHEKVESKFLVNGSQNVCQQPKILPCIGPGSVLVEDPNLQRCLDIHNAVKRNSVSAMSAFINKEYGTLGCIIVNNTNSEVYVVSAKHIVDEKINFPEDPVSVDQNKTMITALLDDTHYTKVPAVVSKDLIHPIIEDCVYVSRGYFGVLGEAQIEDELKFVDVAIFGPLSESFSSVHDVFHHNQSNKCKLEIWQKNHYQLQDKIVQKVGAATGHKIGIVLVTDYLYQVESRCEDGTNKIIRGKTFLVTSYNEATHEKERDCKFGTHGDSGSLVVIKKKDSKHPQYAVGLIHGIIKKYKFGDDVYNDVIVCVYLNHCIDTLISRRNKYHEGSQSRVPGDRPEERATDANTSQRRDFQVENLQLYYHYFKPILCLGNQKLPSGTHAASNVSSALEPSGNMEQPNSSSAAEGFSSQNRIQVYVQNMR